MSDKMFASAKDLKEGRYVIIDGVPCRIVSIDVSKSGKHGASKMRVVGIGVFDGQKKTLLTPGDADVEIPVIEKRTVQILSLSGNSAQVMDSQTYEVFELNVADEFLSQAAPGKEAEILQSMGRRAITRIK